MKALKFASFERQGRESWGLFHNDEIIDLGTQLPQFPTLASFLPSREFLARDGLVGRFRSSIPSQSVRLLPVIPRPEKIICLSRNYLDHHREAVAGGLDRKVTDFPPIFLRVWRSLAAHDQPMILPKVSDQLDFEGELAVILRTGGRHIAEADAMNHVAGYSCFNEGSVRDYQHHAYQITPGKNFQQTGPFGPYLVTTDEVPDAHHLALTTRLNGAVMQAGNTKDLVFGIPRIISYCSNIFELAPGDVIATGTPAGVGWARKPQVWLKQNDIIEIEIEAVGHLRNTVLREQV